MRTRCSLHEPFLLRAALLAALLAAAPGAVHAQETQPAEPAKEPSQGFVFHVDPLVLGVVHSHVDTDSAKWEEYRDLSSGFVIPRLRLLGDGPGDRTLDFNAENLRRDDARYTLSYGIPGRYELTVDYNKIPHHFGNDGHMLWTETSPGRFQIADPIQAAIQNAIAAQYALNPAGVSFAFLNRLISPYLAAAQRIDLGLQRDRFLARLDLGRMGPFAWGLEYDHEKRTGNRAYGGSFGFSNATELPEPIDYDTTGAELGGEWNTATSGLAFGYRFSKFENNVSTMIWDNPFRATSATDPAAYTAPGAGSIGGSALGLADLAASNRADLLYVRGRTRFGTWFATGSASYDAMKQDDPLLPYTLNSAIVGVNANGTTFDPTNPANLPARSADRKTDATSFNGDLGTRFGQNVDLTVRYRYYDLDNKASRLEFPGYVRFDAVWEAIGRITVPYSYTRQTSSAELGWDLAHATRVALSFARDSWDRKFREIVKSDENIWKATFDSRPASWFALRSSYSYGDRSVGRYDVAAAEDSFVEAEVPTNLPDLRKLDEAARKQHLYNLQAQLFPSEAWTFFVGVTGNQQKFGQSVFGLQKDDLTDYNAELSYAPGDNFNLFLFGSRQDHTVDQAARQSGATPSTNPLDGWTANLTEATDTWGAGLTAKLSSRWTLDLSANWSRADGKANLFSPPGGSPDVAVGFDNYDDTRLFTLLGRLDYKISPTIRTGLFGRWEDYKIDSFVLQGLQNYLPGSLLLNSNYGDYRGSLIGWDIVFTF